jgi:UDP-glucose 4-epimerase
MKVLVTGGCGFLGQILVNKLTGAGHEVTIMDNLSNSKPPQSRENFIKGDIRDKSDVLRAMKDCEAVFHLAAITNLRSSDANSDYEVNFLGAKNVFEHAQKTGAKVIFTSSAAIYGNLGICKEDSECKPISQYGTSKLKAENFLKKELPESFIVRPFNIYGPGGKSVINEFAKKIPNYKPVRIFGNGMQTRDYVFVDDVADALILGLANSGIFNVGTGRESSLLEIIDIFHTITKAKPEYKFELPNDKEIKRSRADISKIKELGWEPKTNLEAGIKQTLLSEGWKPLP